LHDHTHREPPTLWLHFTSLHSTQVQLERPTTEALAALCYVYFDTRPTPLAEVNIMDLNNSPFLQNRITQNTQVTFYPEHATLHPRFILDNSEPHIPYPEI
jgi:hypothetical protein